MRNRSVSKSAFLVLLIWYSLIYDDFKSKVLAIQLFDASSW